MSSNELWKPFWVHALVLPRLLTFSIGLACGFFPVSVRAEVPALLQSAIGNWTNGKEDWAFTRTTRIFADGGSVSSQRVEQYDPSLPDSRRWSLVSVDGAPPSAVQLAAEEKKNSRKRKYGSKPPGEILDFSHAITRQETPAAVSYEVPLKAAPAGLAQTDKLIVVITVDRSSKAVERLTAGLRGPMRLALGLAKITDVDFDLNFDGSVPAPQPDEGATTGTGRVAISSLGSRMEYEWSDFRRVNAFQGAEPDAP